MHHHHHLNPQIFSIFPTIIVILWIATTFHPPSPLLNREIALCSLGFLRTSAGGERCVLRAALRSRLSNGSAKITAELARIFERRLLLRRRAGILDAAAHCADEGGIFADAGRVHAALCWEAGDAGLLGFC